MTDLLKKVAVLISFYLKSNFSDAEIRVINDEIRQILDFENDKNHYNFKKISYEELQQILSSFNERVGKRKSNGVYYTANDVVRFIYCNSIKSLYNNLKSTNLHVQDINGIPYKELCYEKTVFDPTCGAGEFLIVALDVKFDMADFNQDYISISDIKKVISTIKGNDIDSNSTIITKIRLFIYVLNRYGTSRITGISKILNSNFMNEDFINLRDNYNEKYDVIIGNPPYVEDSKCDTKPQNKYGNVYANVLENVSKCLNKNGVIGFIIPISYVATQRMTKIRKIMNDKFDEQYILSYCDRPDCLFPSVHQKLCILIGKSNNTNKLNIYTGNYQFWYKEERKKLFSVVHTKLNKYITNDYIPKIGTKLDNSIYLKVNAKKQTLLDLLNGNNCSVFLNMRAAFWIKAFNAEHRSGEYKEFKTKDEDTSCLAICILNSSLFWWYWICVSDCWHITKKELNEFKVPNVTEYNKFRNLAYKLENRLEKTKIYVGTKQTEYEYKHKSCINEIHEIDDLINNLYGLNEEESIYIKNYAYKYRIGGDYKDENN